jgi:recombination protein RecA
MAFEIENRVREQSGVIAQAASTTTKALPQLAPEEDPIG